MRLVLQSPTYMVRPFLTQVLTCSSTLEGSTNCPQECSEQKSKVSCSCSSPSSSRRDLVFLDSAEESTSSNVRLDSLCMSTRNICATHDGRTRLMPCRRGWQPNKIGLSFDVMVKGLVRYCLYMESLRLTNRGMVFCFALCASDTKMKWRRKRWIEKDRSETIFGCTTHYVFVSKSGSIVGHVNHSDSSMSWIWQHEK